MEAGRKKENEACGLARVWFRRVLYFPIVANMFTLSFAVLFQLLNLLGWLNVFIWLLVVQWFSALTVVLAIILNLSLKKYTNIYEEPGEFPGKTYIDARPAFLAFFYVTLIQGVCLAVTFTYRVIVEAAFHGAGVWDHWESNHDALFGVCPTGAGDYCTRIEIICIILDGLQMIIDAIVIVLSLWFWLKYDGLRPSCKPVEEKKAGSMMAGDNFEALGLPGRQERYPLLTGAGPMYPKIEYGTQNSGW